MICTGSATTQHHRHDEFTHQSIGNSPHRTSEKRKFTDADQFASEEAEDIDSFTQRPAEFICCFEHDPDLAIVEAEPAFQDSLSAVSSVASGMSAALATFSRHSLSQLGWKGNTMRRYSSLEAEDSPRITKSHRQLVGWGRLRQEEVFLAWHTHALEPSTQVTQSPCNSVVENAPQQSITHISVKRRKTAHRVSLTSMREADEGWCCWLCRPLRTPWRFASQPSSAPIPVTPAARFSGAYASAFATAHRPPSAIHWKVS